MHSFFFFIFILFMAVLGLCCCTKLWRAGALLIVMCGLLIAVACPVVEHRLEGMVASVVVA